jgi:hypothetical protein
MGGDMLRPYLDVGDDAWELPRLTAAYEVAGDYRDVLIQCFERRCLTYTPGNSPGFETEAAWVLGGLIWSSVWLT